MTEFRDRSFADRSFKERSFGPPPPCSQLRDGSFKVVQFAPERDGVLTTEGVLGDGVLAEQILRMDEWLRRAERVSFYDAHHSLSSASTGFDGVVVSATSLDKEDRKWQQQKATTGGLMEKLRSRLKSFGDIGRKPSPHEG